MTLSTLIIFWIAQPRGGWDFNARKSCGPYIQTNLHIGISCKTVSGVGCGPASRQHSLASVHADLLVSHILSVSDYSPLIQNSIRTKMAYLMNQKR